ncbi:hypothetical protein RDI58_004306 [Solanum bulbocastanum]|uniref:Replication protein A 70 kDa DNA-binding subunit B/D first OB fold domain-containing protein n=1 Tax=Solanum bulbocastanum TaxID=147425 RepID=A0AAN8TYL8_SOLBU
MEQNIRICELTPQSSDWICKTQIVDICGPTESKEKKLNYLNMILQDKEEDQIKGIVYGDDIPCYQDRIKLYHTYYIAGTPVQPSSSKYEKALHAFELVFDKKNVLLELDENDVDALPLPTKLTLTPFTDIKQQVLHATTDLNKKEFDILAIVVNCFPRRYLMSMNKWLQELIVMDIFKHTFTFTIWDQTIMDNQGNKLLQQLHEYPIILARRIGGSRYNGVSLTTKFNTTILIDPPYGQKHQLRACLLGNSLQDHGEQTNTSFTLRSTSKSRTLISIPVDEEVILIANAESQEDGQTFSIEAKISFPPDQKKYYVLVCSNCGQDVRYSIIMQIQCMNCGQHRMLIPMCRFNVNLEDSSGSTTTMIMNKEGEKLLSLTAELLLRTIFHL